jgi:hypothetical protein
MTYVKKSAVARQSPRCNYFIFIRDGFPVTDITRSHDDKLSLVTAHPPWTFSSFHFRMAPILVVEVERLPAL